MEDLRRRRCLARDTNAKRKSAFHLYGKAGFSGRNQKEPSLSLEFFFGKKECLQRFSSFLSFTGIIGISPHHLRCHTSAMLLDEIRGFLKGKIALFHFAKNIH